MLFRTELMIPKSAWELNHGHTIVSIGSCFADVIGTKLGDSQFEILTNPFGTLYNPLSITYNLSQSLLSNPVVSGIVENKGLYFSYNMHSELFAQTPTELAEKINSAYALTKSYIDKANYLVITLGTALVYELNENKSYVANCHKIPQEKFTKRLLAVNEMVDSFSNLIKQIKKVNDKVKIILTVSPVRHTKDTLPLNSASKSSLLLACYQIAQLYPEKVQYFPAFELLNDDLRDYRYYKEDLIHPTNTAENYIWDKFSTTYFCKDTLLCIKEIYSIQQALAHKTFHPGSSEHELFKKKIIEKVNVLNAAVPVPRLIEIVNLKFK